MHRYYLNRFKDVYRQATIDFMLGNPVSEEEFASEKPGEEEESANTAEHVKLLIEDCKKMLISDSSMILGAWGLIDADPVTGDPTETEMDTILILTRDSYYVADYDEQMDRVTKYQQVLLKDITWLEQGTAELSTAGSLFKQSSRSTHHCIRVHYSVDCQPGYFHMFRSAHVRFFNNVAVEIKTQEEMIESLKAVFETFIVAIEIAGVTSVPTTTGQPLEKMKSRVVAGDPSRKPSGLLSSYLDVASIPSMTRNVSETQLTTLKSVGSKALSNMTSQFTKLNRLGQNLNPRSQNRHDGQIQVLKDLQPIENVHPSGDQQKSSVASPKISPVEDDPRKKFALTVLSDREIHKDKHLASVGIVMAHGKSTTQPISANTTGRAPLIHDVSLTRVVQQETSATNHLRKYPLMHSRTDLTLDVSNLVLTKVEPVTKEREFAKTATELVSGQDSKLVPPNSLMLHKNHSHSSGEVTERQKLSAESVKNNTAVGGQDNIDRSQAANQNISASKSENSLKTISDSLTQAITSPSATAKDIVLSPFSKLAKGMQNLGANLDPRKLKTTNTQNLLPTPMPSKVHSEENRVLMERWKNCNTKLIAP